VTDTPRLLATVLRATVALREGRFRSTRLHKASSAEAILAHCLRRRGWTGRFRSGEITGRQRLRLLDDIRFYARAWLRHEAEGLFRAYGRDVSRALIPAVRHHVGRFFDRAKSFVREAILAGVLAFGEPSEAELIEVNRQAQVQAEYFDRFEREVIDRPPVELAETPAPPIFIPPNVTLEPPLTHEEVMSAKQFVARAESYGGSAWQAQNILRAKGQPPGTLEMRVHLRRDRHAECATCTAQTAMGWQPVGTLLPIGDSECLGNCDCFFAFKHPKSKIIWVIGEKPPKGLAA